LPKSLPSHTPVQYISGNMPARPVRHDGVLTCRDRKAAWRYWMVEQVFSLGVFSLLFCPFCPLLFVIFDRAFGSDRYSLLAFPFLPVQFPGWCIHGENIFHQIPGFLSDVWHIPLHDYSDTW